MNLKENLLRGIYAYGFEKPSSIQQRAILPLAQGNDLIAQAQSGTGKTATFTIGALQRIEEDLLEVQTLILAPTRELAKQIQKVVLALGDYLEIRCHACIGGTRVSDDIDTLRNGVHVVVGTPGRVLDLLERGNLRTDSMKSFILDEADEMLSMGFKDDLERIFQSTPNEKQVLLFSATMTPKVVKVTKKYMQNPKKIAVAKENLGAENIEHYFYMVSEKNRYEAIKRIADLNPDIYGIVFCRTRKETKEVASKLMNDQYNADTIHGDLSQNERDDVMQRFRKRHLQILVATDVAARGLDVDDLTHVINYNLPDDEEIYVHRSGRTGRAGNNGISIAIISGREMHRIKRIERSSSIKFAKKKTPTGYDVCKKRLYGLIDQIENVKVDEKQIEQFLPYIYEKLNWLDRDELIKHFVSIEFNRYLSYYKNSVDLDDKEFHNSSKKRKKSRKKKNRSKYRFGGKNKRKN